MSSKVDVIVNPPPEEPLITLPPYICNNVRLKIEADVIPSRHITLKHKVKEDPNAQLVYYPLPKPILPSPLHPLAITWSPEKIILTLSDEKVVVQTLWLWNSSYRMIYVHVCGFWDETIRLGACWQCYPRTRFLLAPGMKGEIYIRATPSDHSPVPFGSSRLQLAAAHMRDHVTGYFLVPVHAKFPNYIPPPNCEGE